MARRRKPTALKVLQGTARPDRAREEPDFNLVDGHPECPSWLTDPEAVAEWERLVGILTPVRVLSAADLTALAHLCALHGAVLDGYRSGEPPKAAQLTQLRLFLTEFGLTPASRSKASTLGSPPEQNPFADLGRKSG